MKKSHFAISFLLSVTVVFLSMPLYECRSASLMAGRSLNAGQSDCILDANADSNAAIESDITFEEENPYYFNGFSSGRVSSFLACLDFYHPLHEVEAQLQVAYKEQFPRPPPFLISL